MGRASIDQIMVGFRVAFESVRQGRCEAPAARRMMQVVLLTSLVSEAGYGLSTRRWWTKQKMRRTAFLRPDATGQWIFYPL